MDLHLHGKKDILNKKKKYNFRILIDDAHGFGCMGPNGRGTSEHYGVMDEIDLYFGAYATMKKMADFYNGYYKRFNY